MDRNLTPSKAKETGSALLIVVLALGLLSAFVMTWGMKDKGKTNLRDASRLIAGRHKISRSLARAAKMKPSIRNSIRAGNEPLKGCITDGVGCPIGTATPLKLYGPIYDSPMIAGEASDPAYYTAFGNLCPPGIKEGCLLQASAYYIPLCEGALPGDLTITCTMPKNIQIVTRVEQTAVPLAVGSRLAAEEDSTIIPVAGLIVP